MAFTRDELLQHLISLGIATETVEHQAVFTVEESRGKRGVIEGAHTKNLFLKCKKGSLWLITALESTPIELKTLHKHLGSGRLSFGSADLLREVLGVEPGSVTTFAAINDAEARVTVVLDAAMMEYERINLHPLENTATTGISREDLVKFLDTCGHSPRIMSFHAQDSTASANE
ncbi:MAG: prolyl-tRNA synthetase associated domain-containing protein [Alphaproteobacteria bacterium]